VTSAQAAGRESQVIRDENERAKFDGYCSFDLWSTDIVRSDQLVMAVKNLVGRKSSIATFAGIRRGQEETCVWDGSAQQFSVIRNRVISACYPLFRIE
jgi:hypothetical protein